MLVVGGEPEPLHSFKNLFTIGKMIEMPIDFSQKMENETFMTNGLFTYYSENQFKYVSHDQSIYFNQDTVWTQNHQTHQIIIDQLMQGEFTFFSILSGQFDGIDFESPILEKGIFNFGYYISDWDVRGKLILYSDGHPKTITIQGSDNQSILISIGEIRHSSIEPFNAPYAGTWEVIDLRE